MLTHPSKMKRSAKMTQVAEKLLEYMQSEYESQGTTRFTAQGIFLESNIDFGRIDAITRAATELEECGKISFTKDFGTGFKLL